MYHLGLKSVSPLTRYVVPTVFVRHIFAGGLLAPEHERLLTPVKGILKDKEDASVKIPEHINEDDLVDPETFLATGTMELQAMREKYNHLDFDELREVLDEADSEFFQYGQPGHPIPTHHRILYDREEKTDLYNAELEKLDYIIPHKWQVGMWRSSRLFKGSFKIQYRSILVGGNGKGLVSFGFGSGDSPWKTWDKAKEDLRKNILDVSLIEGRTIHDDLVGKFNRTRVLLFNRPRGFGMRAGKLVGTICQASGILDLSSKVVGRRNPFTVVRATFDALAQAKTFRQIALDTGLNYYEMSRGDTFIRKDRPPSEEEMQQRTQEIQGLIMKAGIHHKHVRTIRDEWSDVALVPPNEDGEQKNVHENQNWEEEEDLHPYDLPVIEAEEDFWREEGLSQDVMLSPAEEYIFDPSMDWAKFMTRKLDSNEEKKFVEEEMVQEELARIGENEENKEKAEILLAQRKKEKWWEKKKKSKSDEKREEKENMRNIIQEIDTNVGLPNHPMFDTYKVPSYTYEPLTKEEKMECEIEWSDERLEQEWLRTPNHEDVDQETVFRKLGYGYAFAEGPSPKHLYDKFQVEKVQDEVDRQENEKKLESAQLMEVARQKVIREMKDEYVHDFTDGAFDDAPDTDHTRKLIQKKEQECINQSDFRKADDPDIYFVDSDDLAN